MIRALEAMFICLMGLCLAPWTEGPKLPGTQALRSGQAWWALASYSDALDRGDRAGMEIPALSGLPGPGLIIK